MISARVMTILTRRCLAICGSEAARQPMAHLVLGTGGQALRAAPNMRALLRESSPRGPLAVRRLAFLRRENGTRPAAAAPHHRLVRLWLEVESSEAQTSAPSRPARLWPTTRGRATPIWYGGGKRLAMYPFRGCRPTGCAELRNCAPAGERTAGVPVPRHSQPGRAPRHAPQGGAARRAG